MTRAGRIATIVFTTFALLVVAIWVRDVVYQHHLEAAYVSVSAGTSLADLQARLGEPWKTGACGETYGEKGPANCSKEVVYTSPFDIVAPESWSYYFDPQGKLLDKYRWVSP
jgi:hypothetical protein